VPLIVSVGGTASAAALPAGSMRASAHTAVHTNEYSEMRFMKILRSFVYSYYIYYSIDRLEIYYAKVKFLAAKCEE